jgi:hypothetical protein
MENCEYFFESYDDYNDEVNNHCTLHGRCLCLHDHCPIGEELARKEEQLRQDDRVREAAEREEAIFIDRFFGITFNGKPLADILLEEKEAN